MHSLISSKRAAELRQLNADYLVASICGAETLLTDGRPLSDAEQCRAVDADAKVTAIVQRMKEIIGTVGHPWNA
jgi:hypothetical protein